MRLGELLIGQDIENIKGARDIEISGIAFDSRNVDEGYVFVAIEGFRVDGHKFIQSAISKGTKVLVVQKDIEISDDVTVVKVPDTRRALARLASNYYGNPSTKLDVVGITGTNGKTSITYMIKSILENVGRKTGLIGTIGNVVGSKFLKAKNTTPESLELQEIFGDMVENDFDSCVMEVSSHSIELNRIGYTDFNIGVFTNLSTDHMDLHKDMENYFKSKLKLFYLSEDCNVINYDDKYGKRIIEELKDVDTKLMSYGLDSNADIYASDINYYPDGVEYTANTPKGSVNVRINIPGEIYVYNSLAALACCYSMGLDLNAIVEGLEKVKGIKGRLEVIPSEKKFTTIVDYAHTGDGLEKVLKTFDKFVTGRKIVVFGAGGEKGQDKRWEMGRVAGKYCDLSIVTSDNPKNEDPLNIMAQIIEAIEEEKGEYVAIVDREEAIKFAIEVAKDGDIILIAGKGHEDYQIIGDTTYSFSDREVAERYLKAN